jgi:uncharacterized hydrophobic protein (TIGR00271 family)
LTSRTHPTTDAKAASSRFREWLPRLEREERRELSIRIAGGAIVDADFLVMMGLSTGLASLGLLQSSTAVVIGAMLVAPLMGPLMAGGLALVQANIVLFRMALGVSALGIALGLGVSALVGFVNPGFEPTMEIEARGTPDLMDLGIAFASGMAGAYAMGRPKVAATLAGVAIAAALVPPLAVVGIALTNFHPWIAGNAVILLVTNLVAIMLGAAAVFQVLGIGASESETARPPWVHRTVILLVLATVLLSAPLFLNVLAQRRAGQTRPLLYPVSAPVREAVESFVANWPEITLIMIGRPGVEPDESVGVLLASHVEIPPAFDTGLRAAIREARDDDPQIRIYALRSAYPPPADPDERSPIPDASPE